MTLNDHNAEFVAAYKNAATGSDSEAVLGVCTVCSQEFPGEGRRTTVGRWETVTSSVFWSLCILLILQNLYSWPWYTVCCRPIVRRRLYNAWLQNTWPWINFTDRVVHACFFAFGANCVNKDTRVLSAKIFIVYYSFSQCTIIICRYSWRSFYPV